MELTSLDPKTSQGAWQLMCRLPVFECFLQQVFDPSAIHWLDILNSFHLLYGLYVI